MPTLNSLCTSISDMADEQAMQLIMGIRQYRRVRSDSRRKSVERKAKEQYDKQQAKLSKRNTMIGLTAEALLSLPPKARAEALAQLGLPADILDKEQSDGLQASD